VGGGLQGAEAGGDADEDEMGGPGDYRDGGVETLFTEDTSRPWASWRGDVSGFPEWLQAISIAITPPVTGGGWHSITLKSNLHSSAVEKAMMLRVNGVWCVGMPVVDKFDASGQGRFAGTFWYQADIDDLEEIRSYGDGLTVPNLVNEPIPPRTKGAIFRLRRLVSLPYAEDAAWQADIKQLWQGLVGIGAGQGQLDVHTSQMHRYARRQQHYDRLLRQAWGRASTGMALEAWANSESGDPKKWLAASREMGSIKRHYYDRVASYQTSVAQSRTQYEEALARCVAREERYADVIPHLYPAG